MQLFKYCSGAGAVGIIKGRCIWFSQPAFLNDPFELNPSAKFKGSDEAFVTESLRDIYLTENFAAKGFSFKQFEAHAREDALKNVGAAKESRQPQLFADLNAQFALLCLTSTPDNLPMWAHYAEHHKGAVIQFDGAHEFFNPQDIQYAVRKVEYTSERPWVGLMEETDAAQILFTKSKHWEYESEFRQIRAIRQGRMVDTPRGVPAYAFDIPPRSIAEVTFGCRMLPAVKAELLSMLEHADFRHIAIRQAKIHVDDFALEYEAIRRK